MHEKYNCWNRLASFYSVLLCVSDWDTRRKRKIAEITQALSVSPVDVASLRRMAISEGGLLTDEIRSEVWPRLLNVPLHVLDQEPGNVIVLATHANTVIQTTVHNVSCLLAIDHTFPLFLCMINMSTLQS